MRTTTFLLSCSVGLNVALSAVWLASPKSHRSVAADLSLIPPAASPVQRAESTRNLWQHLSGNESPRAVRDRLRAAGFPEPVVRKVLEALLQEQFEARRHRIDDAVLHLDYKKPWPNTWRDPKLGPELRKVNEEEAAVWKALFGNTPPEAEEDRAFRQQRWGDLSEEKIQQVGEYLRQWNEKRMQLFSGKGERIQLLPEDAEKLAAINRSLREGLAGILTPTEVNEYLVRNSQPAMMLQHVLAPLRVNEQEYRTIFAAYQNYADQFPMHPFLGNLDNAPADQAAALKAGADTLVAQLNASLPPDRVADVQLALDPQFSELGRLVNRLDLPMTAAKQVYDVQQSTLKQAKVINADMSLTTDTRNAQLTTLQQDATATIGKALGGKRGLNAYKQLGGAWLTTLVPKPGKG